MFLRKTIEKQERRIDELHKEIIALLKSRRTPEGNIIADNTSMEILRDLFLMELNIPKIPKKLVAGESITYYAELDLANIEEGQIIGTKDPIDSEAIEAAIEADLDEYGENLMQSYGQAVGSYLTMEDNSVIPQGYLLADGSDRAKAVYGFNESNDRLKK